jgi:hypothetical protein
MYHEGVLPGKTELIDLTYLSRKGTTLKGVALLVSFLLIALAGCAENETSVSVRDLENSPSSGLTNDTPVSQATQSYPITEMFNPCNGENISTSGTITISTQTVHRPDGLYSMSYHLTTNRINGVGQTTGTRYQIKENSNYYGTWDGTSSSASQVITFSVHAFSSDVSDFMFKLSCMASVDDAGTSTLTHYTQSYICR